MKMRAIAAVFAGLAPALFPGAHAQQPPAAAPPAPTFAAANLSERGVRAMVANCAPCHGTNGKAAAASSVAGLAGRGDIAEAMKAFKGGKRDATLMTQIAKGYSDAEIDAMAAYFAALPR